MGDEVLKKIAMMIPVLALNVLANAGTMQTDKEALIAEYRDMFQKISQKRIGIDERKIDKLKAPFLTEEKKVEVKKEKTAKHSEPFSLQAIFGKRAKISGHWYKVHDEVNGMKVVLVGDGFVWLKNSQFRKKLKMGNKNEKISIK